MNQANCVSLTGCLVTDADLFYSPMGLPRLTFRLAVPRGDGALARDLSIQPSASRAAQLNPATTSYSVEAALAGNLCCGRRQIGPWSGETTLSFALAQVVPGTGQVSIDPSGGRDREGNTLQPVAEHPCAGGFCFWPLDPPAVHQVDPVTGTGGTLTRYPQPYQTLSMSPDRRRILLRWQVLTPGQSVGVTGRAYLFDVQTGQVTDLSLAAGLFRAEWSQDGGLLAHGPCPQGQCAVWVPARRHPATALRLPYATGDGRRWGP